MTSTPHDACAECARLREQAAAALLTADRSRLSDVRVLQRRHADADHAVSPRATARADVAAAIAAPGGPPAAPCRR